MKFINMKLDGVMQTAEMYYDYNGENLVYVISASHKKGSFGYKVEDKIIDKYSMDVYGKEIIIKQYQVKEESIEKFSASFKEMGLKYFLTGTMGKEEFELIINNLHFFW